MWSLKQLDAVLEFPTISGRFYAGVDMIPKCSTRNGIQYYPVVMPLRFGITLEKVDYCS